MTSLPQTGGQRSSAQRNSQSNTTQEMFKSADCMMEQALADGYVNKNQAKKLEKLQQKGVVCERTVADYLAEQGKNPFAVDQLGLDILVRFRRKMFALLIVQCGVTMGVAYLVANSPLVRDLEILYHPETFIRDAILCLASWAFSVISLCMVGAVRYKSPQNIMALAIFTVFMSITLALMAGRNVHLGLLMVFLGLVFVGAVSCIKIRGKVIEIFPITIVCMVVVNVLVVLWAVLYAERTNMGLGYVVLVMVLNSVGLCWSGYEMDRLCSRLRVDEYMLPVVLLWAELLVTLLLLFSTESMCQAAGNCEGNCYMWSYTTWHCDCWIYSDGSYGKDKYRKDRKVDVPVAAPQQQSMMVTEKEYAATCDQCGAKLGLGDHWYHKAGCLDLCKQHFEELPEVDQTGYAAMVDASKLGAEAASYASPAETFTDANADKIANRV